MQFICVALALSQPPPTELNAGGSSGWTTSSFAALVPAPAAPSGLVASPTTTGAALSWGSVSGATSYVVEVHSNANFTSLKWSGSPTSASASASGLLSGTTYYWRVKAVNASGSSGWTTSSFATLVPAPAAPSGLAASPTTTGAALSWGSVSGATSYVVEVHSNANFTSLNWSGSPTSASASASGLLSGTTYYWRVQAVNAGGSSGWTTSSFATLVPAPSAPTLSTPASGSNGTPVSQTVSWNPVSGATSYTLQYSTSSDFRSDLVTQSGLPSTSYNVTGLANATKYYWHVSATNAGGTGAYSNFFSFTTIVRTPTDLGYSKIFGWDVLHWSQVTGADSYAVEVYTDVSYSANSLFYGDTTTSYWGFSLLRNLQDGTRYYWRVRASNEGFFGSWATSSFTTSGSPPVNPPSAPSLSSPSNGATGIATTSTLSWTSSSGATSYRLQVSTSSSFSTTVVNDSTLTGTSQTVGPLNNGTLYYWRVNAKNSGGTSSYSSTYSFTTIIAAPTAPTLTLPANNATSVSVTPSLTWNQVSGATSFTLQVSTTSAFTSFTFNQSGLTTTSGTASGLTNNTTYYWRVSATNAGGTSQYSSAWTFTTIVAAPPAPSLTSPADNATGVSTSPTITWGTSSGATSYRLQLSTSSQFSSTVLDDSSLTGTSRLGGPLANGTKYYWRVRAKNAGGTSSYSSNFSFTTIIAVPGGVSGLAATPTTNGAALTWGSVSGAAWYIVEVYNASFTSRLSRDSVVSAALTVGGLSPGTDYAWRVQGANSAGSGGWTNAAFRTPTAIPVAPGNLASTPSTSGASMSWALVTGSTSYIVEVYTDFTFTTRVFKDSLASPPSIVRTLSSATKYYWRVQAINSGGASGWTISSFTTSSSLPNPPSAPTLASPANGTSDVAISTTLTWNAASGGTSYRLQLSTSPTFSTTVVDDSTLGGTSRSIGPLANNTQYYWRVSAANAGGTSPYSTVWSFTTIVAAPPAPTLSLPANNSGDQPVNLTLGWNAAQGATNYRVQVSTSTNFASLVMDDPTVTGTSRSVGPLANNTQYYWRVSAANAGGTSQYSTVWSFTTIVAAPPAPTLSLPLNNSVDQPLSLTLGWNAAQGATKYRVQLSTSTNFSSFVVDDPAVTGTSLQAGPLSNNTQYFWRVMASNVGGSSSYSTVFSFTTIVAPPPAPRLAAPQNNAANVSISPAFTWDASEGAASYTIQVSTLADFSTLVATQSGITGTSYGAAALSNNTRYYWRVRGTNVGGTGLYSSAFSFTTIVAPPGAPTPTSPADNTTGVGTTPTLAWTSPAGATRYRLQLSTSSTFNPTILDDDALASPSRQVGPLSNNTAYYWRVSAANDGGTSSFSTTFSFTTVLAGPPTPSLSSPANGSTGIPVNPALTWIASAGAASYTVQVSASSDFSTILSTQAGVTATSYGAAGLSANTQYYWRVSATNAGGTSPYSAAFSFTTVVSPPAAPALASPLNGSASVQSNPTLSWNGSSGASSYTLQVSTASDFSSTVVNQSGVTGTSFNVVGLTNNTQYYWRVSATNVGGTSPYSMAFSFTTVVTAPSAPTLASPSNGSVNAPINPGLSWNSSPGADSYNLQLSTASDFSSLHVNQTGITGTSFTAVGLSNSTQYFWRVSATNAGGTSAFSATFSFTTVIAAPGPPTLALPANGATDLSTAPTLSWNSSSGASSYTVQVSTSSGFSSYVLNQSGVTSTFYTLSGLAASTQYFWRVSATNSGGTTAFSTAFSFTTSAPAPAAPVLSSPANGMKGIRSNPTLSWNAVAGAATYTLQVSLSSNFSSFMFTQSAITATSFDLSGLIQNTQYFWRVSASNPGGTSAWSSVWNFTIEPVLPTAPTLSAPADGAANLPRLVTFGWAAATNAVAYHLQVSEDPLFSTNILDLRDITSLTMSVSFDYNTTYYWRVSAINPGGEGAFSKTRSFSIVRTTGVELFESGLPSEYSLMQNYPNPFNPSTTIRFSIPSSSNVKLAIYDALGNLVHLLVNGRYAPGQYSTTWNASSQPSGVYFYRIQTDTFVETRRLVLLK
ncbi:MAG: fibronectin type III domain-containing protein [Ignavibacteriales bacterium]|nr:fibronectin type III domain-containing protein [Ignavibacteriales bacterium]